MKTLHIIPNAHLDPVWLWDATEGLDQGVRSIRATLDLMDEFPFLTYVRGEAVLYRHVEETAPDLFARICGRIREGRWDVVGGTVIQPDTNLPSVETLRKQFELGLDWFKGHLEVWPTCRALQPNWRCRPSCRWPFKLRPTLPSSRAQIDERCKAIYNYLHENNH